ncbi:MAG TPA: DUF5996 family protein [Fimbriimonadaceae bacterium]|jgi:hypothetical protein
MNLPPLELSDWEDSRLKWQLICQMIGKVRLKTHPFMNHWWHVPLYPSPHGLTTADIPYKGGIFSVDVDILGSLIRIETSKPQIIEIPLGSQPFCEIYEDFRRCLRDVGVEVKIWAQPYKCKSTIPFAQDEQHCGWDIEAVTKAWRILTEIEPVFKEFRSRFIGKCSPVHMFWHSFDLAVTRFSGRRAPPMPEADHTTQEAYSHEVNSAGFWFGDDNMREAAFYCYTAPAPAGLTDQPLRPANAFWNEQKMALLRYNDLRESQDPKRDLLEFLQSSYEAGVNAADWDRALLERN